MTALAAFVLYLCLVAPLVSVLIVTVLPSWVVVVAVRRVTRALRACARIWSRS